MPGFSAVLDTDALHPVHVRNTLLQLASAKLFKPLWTQRILDELAHSLLRRGVTDKGHIVTLVYRLATIFPDSLVESYEELESQVVCPDPNDRHVLAAAVVARAGAIVTFNTKDFPKDSFDRFGIEILHPDDFLMSQATLNELQVLRTLAIQIGSYSRPRIDSALLADFLERSSCTAFAGFLRVHSADVDSQVKRLREAQAQ